MGPLDGLVYTTLQELATRISHRNTGRFTEDPNIEKLTARIAVDENLHYVFYRDVASAAIELDASAMVLAMHRQVLGFQMPGLELPGFRPRRGASRRSGPRAPRSKSRSGSDRGRPSWGRPRSAPLAT